MISYVKSAVIVGALIACTVPVSADFRDSYRRAIQARNRQNWTEAATWLRRAIEEQPKESGDAINISGTQFEPYLPYFQLGLALYNRQDCAGALDAWTVSERAQAVLRSKYAEAFRKSRFDCEGRVARATDPPPAQPAPSKAQPAVPVTPGDPVEVTDAIGKAEVAIRAVERIDDAVRALAADPLLKGDGLQQAALTAGQTRAQGFLAEARDALETGRANRDVRMLRSAATLAASAGQQFDLIRQAAETRRAQLQEQQLARNNAPPVAPAAPAAAPVTNAAAAALDTKLVVLIDAYIQGRHRDATTLARQFREATGSVGAQAALFGAAAHYSLFVRGGERDRTERDQAVAYVRRARQLDPAAAPDLRMFSPRFAQFFRGQR